MAELPDLSAFAKTLNHKFKNRTLTELEIRQGKKLNVSEKALKTALENHKLTRVERAGKTLQFHFGKDRILGIHLMLRGELQEIGADQPLPKHTILAFHFSKNGFALTDSLKQATPTLNPAENHVPDALEISEAELESLLSRRKKTIKEVLMDQKAIRGIGNSYGDEILWAARISPLSTSNKIPEQDIKKLHQSITKTLRQAIADIEKENGTELHGELRDFMKVHGSSLKTSPTGAPIKSTKIAGRTAYYTDEQQLFT